MCRHHLHIGGSGGLTARLPTQACTRALFPSWLCAQEEEIPTLKELERLVVIFRLEHTTGFHNLYTASDTQIEISTA